MTDAVTKTRDVLLARLETLDTKSDILKAPELKALFRLIPAAKPSERATLGQQINALQQELAALVERYQETVAALPAIDVTAPMDVNTDIPEGLSAAGGTVHPLSKEIQKLEDIFERMGYRVEDSREIDDQYHMFESLNFPKGHPARDDWDTFMTVETDANGDQLIAPAHTSTMQNRILRTYADELSKGKAIAAIVPDRVFRNEDLDARHEHTFYQLEGVYVDTGVHAGMLVATLQSFLQEYYGQELDVRMNPYYFPFTEPSFEFMMSCPFCDKAGCSICGHEGWIEILGCGMIHPNVLRAADIDPQVYTGFAFGCGIDRLVMMKNAIEDVRHFHSAKLDFLRQF
jgi:phenylalanyl-tRNA synthetase alpha chain